MSILNKTELCKGDLYEHFNTIYCGLELSYSDRVEFEKSLYNAINECPLDKWPGQVEDRVKSLLNAQNRDVKNVVIVEGDHPIFQSEIVYFEFWIGCMLSFSVYANVAGNENKMGAL